MIRGAWRVESGAGAAWPGGASLSLPVLMEGASAGNPKAQTEMLARGHVISERAGSGVSLSQLEFWIDPQTAGVTMTPWQHRDERLARRFVYAPARWLDPGVPGIVRWCSSRCRGCDGDADVVGVLGAAGRRRTAAPNLPRGH